VEAQYDAAVAQAAAARDAVEQQLLVTAAALEESRQTRASEAVVAAEHLTRREAELGALLAEATELRQVLEGRLVEAERARATGESERQRLSAEYDQVRRTLGELRGAYHALEGVSSDHATERARLEILLAERDAQMSAQAASHLAAQQASHDALRQIEERLRSAEDANRREVAQLQRELHALRQALDVTTGQRDALRKDADQVPVLQSQLDRSHVDNRRQFEHAPYGVCRCSRGGVIAHANRALVELLGYRTADDLQKVDFATTIFESADDLHWLIERSVNAGTLESIETTWRRKDRRRLVVRLHAAAVNDSIELIAEDITNLRAVEERLRQAQRMEAVGRLASEVAVTCDNLLRDVTQDGRRWLAAVGSDTAIRHQGEQLLGEVTRAAGFLRQLGVYGNTQVNALEPVSVNRVLKDMEAVLKRLTGDDIELILPKAAPSVDVDVDAERVERVLVNVASYARERMPHGGRLKIDLSTVVVDRRFIAKYPNVRPGDHALITVTEIRGTVPADGPSGLRPAPSAADTSAAPADKPGVDLGALLGLIGDCGGHLWMTAEPHGNMVLKIHLPARVPEAPTDARAPRPRADRGRAVARWFRH
jgi:PAS domain S-box-containing protein